MSEPTTPMTGDFMRLPSPSPSAAPSLISSASPPSSPKSNTFQKRATLIEPHLTLKPTLKPPSSKRISKRLSANVSSSSTLTEGTPVPYDNVTSQKMKGERRRSAAARLSISSLRSLSRSPSRNTASPNRLSTIEATRQTPPSPLILPSPLSFPNPAISTTSSFSRTKPPISTAYNPLLNYLPCMHLSCSTHYLPATLSPSYYSPQKPYGLRHKRGLCPAHASKDLKAANEEARQEWESLRQNAGRKNLATVQGEHEAYIRILDVRRVGEGAELEARLRGRVLGGWEDVNPTSPTGLGPGSGSMGKRDSGRMRDSLVSGPNGLVNPLVALKSGGSSKSKGNSSLDSVPPVKEEWDWRYTPRPCTKKGCTAPWYCPFSVSLYPLYTTPSLLYHLEALTTLCPTCTRVDIETVESALSVKRKEIKDEDEWEIVLEKVRRDREIEKEFWEKAQGRVVKERGVRFKLVSEEKKKEKEVELHGKGFEVLRELCVVM